MSRDRLNIDYSFNPTLVPSKHQLNDFEINIGTYMPELTDSIHELPVETQAFIGSLCYQYVARGSLSSKQCFHACRWWLQITARKVRSDGIEYRKIPPNTATTGTAANTDVATHVRIDGTQLLAMFDHAAETLEWPRIRYEFKPPVGHVGKITFYRTGDKSREPGSICIVTANEENANENQIIGMIQRSTKSVLWYRYSFNQPELQAAIKKVAENPVDFFAANGKLFNNCCFCGKPLTHHTSVHHGYGPVCAEKYCLPWDDSKVDVLTDKLDVGLPTDE